MGAGKIPEDIEKQAEERRLQLEPMSPDLAKIFYAPQETRKFRRKPYKEPKAESKVNQLKKIFKVRGVQAELRLRLELITDLATQLERTHPGIKEKVSQEVKLIKSLYKGKSFQVEHLDEVIERLECYRTN